jgi:hypothetical protein
LGHVACGIPSKPQLPHWDNAGKPGIDAFGVTASADDDDQRVWLGDPRSTYSWPLPI